VKFVLIKGSSVWMWWLLYYRNDYFIYGQLITIFLHVFFGYWRGR